MMKSEAAASAVTSVCGDKQHTMSITEGQRVLPPVTPRWRSHYFWLLFVLGVGAIYLTYRTAGSEALFTVLLYGSLVGTGFVVVSYRWLQWFSLLVFSGVMIGGIAAVELTVRDGSVPVNWWHDSGVPTLNCDGDNPFRILAQRTMLGAFLGGIVGVMLTGWLQARFGWGHENGTSLILTALALVVIWNHAAYCSSD